MAGMQTESGLTYRTWWVIVYGALVLMPANVYLTLVSGQSLLGPISFVALILWVELARLMRAPLKPAEAFIVYAIAGIAAGQMTFYTYAVHPAYFRISEYSEQFRWSVPADLVAQYAHLPGFNAADQTVPYSSLAPSWWAPSREVIEQRSFFHIEWLWPILIGMAVWIFHMMADIAMGIVGKELFIKVEKLPFPFAHPTAEACLTMTQDKPEFRRVFAYSGLIGSGWGLLIYWPLAFGMKLIDYPIPWWDAHRLISRYTALNGMSFGIATDLLAFTGGFVIPRRVVVSMFVGSAAVWLVGNPLLVQNDLFHGRFFSGMRIETMMVQQIYVWLPIFIAAMVAAALLHLIAQPKALYQAFANLRKTAQAAKKAQAQADAAARAEAAGEWVGPTGLAQAGVAGVTGAAPPAGAEAQAAVAAATEAETLSTTRLAAAERTLPIGRLLALFFGSIIFAVVMFTFLVPEFPWWFIAPVALIWSFLFSLIDMRAKGTTGFKVDPPHMREGLILLSGHSRPEIWFAPWPISLGSAQWTENFKVCELVKCTPRSYIAAAIVGTLVGMVANLLFMQIFWSIAPIPSAQYPYAAKILPAWATQVCLWMSTTLPQGVVTDPAAQRAAAEMSSVFNISWMLYTGLAFAAVFAVGKIFKRLELSLIGLAVGMMMPIPVAFSLLAGVGIARLIEWKAGKAWFGQYRYIVVAGLSVGEGVVVGLVACVAALSNALVALPY